MTTLTAPAHEDMLADAWLYALGVTDNARRKLTNHDVDAQPGGQNSIDERSRIIRAGGDPGPALPQWEAQPLSRLANWYVHQFCADAGTESDFIRSLSKERHFTPAQVRGAVNVMLGEFKRGARWGWMAAR